MKICWYIIWKQKNAKDILLQLLIELTSIYMYPLRNHAWWYYNNSCLIDREWLCINFYPSSLVNMMITSRTYLKFKKHQNLLLFRTFAVSIICNNRTICHLRITMYKEYLKNFDNVFSKTFLIFLEKYCVIE